jgi:tripartite ATP-independent transporter DctM subunit
MGPVMGSGGLAILIPPSALAVLLGSVAGIDIAALLLAGVGPGVLLGAMFALLIFVQCKLNPNAAPSYDAPRIPWLRRLRMVSLNILPMSLVVFCVIGLMLLGIATATESAAFGVLGTLVLTVAYGRISWDLIRKSLEGTVKVTVMVFFIIMASKTFSLVFGYSGATTGMIDWATSFHLSPISMLLIMYGILLVLGCFVDSVSMMLLTVPVFIPLAKSLGFDLVWFGVIMMLSIEMSALTPPFGSILFVMMGVAPKGTTFSEVVRAGVPYMLCDLVMVGLLIAFPAIALFLPRVMLQ